MGLVGEGTKWSPFSLHETGAAHSLLYSLEVYRAPTRYRIPITARLTAETKRDRVSMLVAGPDLNPGITVSESLIMLCSR